MTEKIDDVTKAERAVAFRLGSLLGHYTDEAITEALLQTWLGWCRRVAGPAETAVALRRLADFLEQEFTPGMAAGPNAKASGPKDIDGALPAVNETAAALQLRGFSSLAIADAFFAAGTERALRTIGAEQTATILDALALTFRARWVEPTQGTRH